MLLHFTKSLLTNHNHLDIKSLAKINLEKHLGYLTKISSLVIEIQTSSKPGGNLYLILNKRKKKDSKSTENSNRVLRNYRHGC